MEQGKDERLLYLEDMLRANMRLAKKNRMKRPLAVYVSSLFLSFLGSFFMAGTATLMCSNCRDVLP